MSSSADFDLDSSSIGEIFEGVIAADAEHLTMLDSREYNLAPGSKRAQVAKGRLILLLLRSARLDAVSFGKEKPRASRHDEAAWAENRHVDFDVQP